MRIGIEVINREEEREEEKMVGKNIKEEKRNEDRGEEIRKERIEVEKEIKVIENGDRKKDIIDIDRIVIGKERGNRIWNIVGGKNEGKDRIVDEIDERKIEKKGREEDEREKGEGKIRKGLKEEIGNWKREIGKEIEEIESIEDGRMSIEKMELIEWREIGVIVIEVKKKEKRKNIVIKMIEEREEEGFNVKRKEERMMKEERFVIRRIKMKKIIKEDEKIGRLEEIVKIEIRNEMIGEWKKREIEDKKIFKEKRNEESIVREKCEVELEENVESRKEDKREIVIIE